MPKTARALSPVPRCFEYQGPRAPPRVPRVAEPAHSTAGHARRQEAFYHDCLAIVAWADSVCQAADMGQPISAAGKFHKCQTPGARTHGMHSSAWRSLSYRWQACSHHQATRASRRPPLSLIGVSLSLGRPPSAPVWTDEALSPSCAASLSGDSLHPPSHPPEKGRLAKGHGAWAPHPLSALPRGPRGRR